MGCGVQPPPNIPPRQPNVVSLDPQDWYVFYSAEMPSHPSLEPNGAWSLSIPNLPVHVSYIQTPFSATVALHNVTITFRIESNAPQYVITTTFLQQSTYFSKQQNDNAETPMDAGGRPGANMTAARRTTQRLHLLFH